MKVIDVYAVPRSGTNFFANYLAKYDGVHAVNTGGGRYPFRSPNSFSSSMSQNIPFLKVGPINHIVKDELHLEMVGRKVHWFNQFVYGKISNSHRKIVLLRNPFSIMRSMHLYYKNYGTHSIWNMEIHANQKYFVTKYEAYFKKINDPNFMTVFVDQFASDRDFRERLVRNLGFKNKSEQTYKCVNGHVFKSNNMRCDCGDITGQGDFDYDAEIDVDRLNKKLSKVISSEYFESASHLIADTSIPKVVQVIDGKALFIK